MTESIKQLSARLELLGKVIDAQPKKRVRRPIPYAVLKLRTAAFEALRLCVRLYPWRRLL